MSRSKLRVINGAKAEPQRSLLQTLRSDSIAETTESALARLTRNSEYIIPPLEQRIGIPSKPMPFGTCLEFFPNGAKERRLIIDEAFPQSLPQICELESKETAVQAAAIFIRAYDVIIRAMRHGSKRKQISRNTLELLAKPSRPEVWNPMEAQSVWNIPYRAAGLVVREALDLSADMFDADAEGLPMHIAGLIDPLSKGPMRGGPSVGFNALSGVIQKGS